MVLNFKVVYIVVVLLQYENETAAQMNAQNTTVACSNNKQRTNEARTISRANNNHFKYLSYKQKVNGSSRIKRQVTVPNLFGLGTTRINDQLSPVVSAQLSPRINLPLRPGINVQLNPGIIPPLSPGIIAPLSPGIVAPSSSGMNSPLSPGINDQVRPESNDQVSPEMNNQVSPESNDQVSPDINNQMSPRVNSSVSPRVNSSVSPIVNSSLSPEINDQVRLGIIDQLSPEIFKQIPNITEQISVSGTTNSVKYPVQVFIIYPKDIDKDSDVITEKTPLAVDNINISSIRDALNPNILEKNKILNSIATNSFANMIILNSANNSHPIINNTTQIATNKTINAIDPNHIKSSINNTNKTDISSTHLRDKDYLKNDTHRTLNNDAEIQLLHTSTKSVNHNRENSTVPLTATFDSDNVTDSLKNNDGVGSSTSSDYDNNDNTANENMYIPDDTDTKQHGSRRVLSAAQVKNKLQANAYETKPIHNPIKYIPIEKIKCNSQNTNSTKHEKTDYVLENSKADSDGKNIELPLKEIEENSVSNNASKVSYPCLNNFYNFYPELGNWWTNHLNHVYKNNGNASIHRCANMYQNMPTYPYQKTEGTTESFGQMTDSKLIYNEKENNRIQVYSNILPVFKYPVNLWKHQEPQTIPEGYEIYNGNDLNKGYNQKGNYALQDYRYIPSEFEYPLDPNNKTHLMAYKNWYNANQEYANIRPTFKYQNYNQNVIPGNVAVYRKETNRNDIRGVHINQNNDPAVISRNFDLYYKNNNGYGVVNLNNEITAEPKRIPCRCNQQSSLIKCNGFYENQSGPITYPTYFYYPYAYRHLHHLNII